MSTNINKEQLGLSDDGREVMEEGEGGRERGWKGGGGEWKVEERREGVKGREGGEREVHVCSMVTMVTMRLLSFLQKHIHVI